jgi:hypothetical protein
VAANEKPFAEHRHPQQRIRERLLSQINFPGVLSASAAAVLFHYFVEKRLGARAEERKREARRRAPSKPTSPPFSAARARNKELSVAHTNWPHSIKN